MFTLPRTESATRAIFFADAAVNGCWAVMLGVLMTLALVVARHAGANAMVIGAGVAVTYAASLCAGLLPRLCRRWPLGGVMLTLRLLSSLCLLPMLLAPSLATLELAYFGAVLLGLMADTAYPALLNAIYPRAAHTRAMGLIFTIKSIAILFMSVLAGWLLNGLSRTDGIRLLGGLMVFGLLSVALMWRFRGVREEHAGGEITSPKAGEDTGAPRVGEDTSAPRAGEDTGAPRLSPWRNRAFIWYLVGLTFFGSGGIVGTVAWPVLQADRAAFQLNYGQVGLLAAAASLAQMGAYLYISRLSRIHAGNRQLVLPYTLTAVNMAMCLALLLLGVRGTPAFLLLLPSLALTSVGTGLQGMYFYLVVNAMADGGSVLGYQAAQNIVVGTRGLIVPLIAGVLLKTAGLAPTAAASVALILIGATLAWSTRPAHPTPSRAN